MQTVMWHWLKQCMRTFRLRPGRGGRRTTSKLMGLYLDQANQLHPPRDVGDPSQERRDGRYAQRRERD